MQKVLILVFLFFIQFVTSAQCDLSELRFSNTDCTPNGVFSVTIDFDYVNQGSKGFRIQGNGKNYGEFSYEDLPVTINALPGDCVTPYEFVMRDIEFPDCSIFKDLGKVCCENCEIAISHAVFSDCENGGFDVTLDVEKSGTGNLGADIFFNGEAIKFVNYNDFPVKLTNLTPLSDVDNVIIVCNNDDVECCDTLVFDSPCQCKIFDTRHRIIECNEEDSTYYLRVNFDHQLVSDSFQIGYNAQYFGTYAYNQLPINIGPIPFHQDTINFLILDDRNSFCFGEILVPPFHNCDTECRIESVTAHIMQESLCENEGTFFVELNVEAHNPGVKGFKVVGNGRVYAERLLYGKDRYIIGPLKGDCKTIYEFVVVDHELTDCHKGVGLEEPVCCESCHLSELSVEPICFEGDLVGTEINFEYIDVQDSLFKLFFGDSLVGTFAYADLPLAVFGNIHKSSFLAKVIDNSDHECQAKSEVKLECPSNDCPEFFNFVFEYGDCLDDGSVFLDFEFRNEGMRSDSFYVKFLDKTFGPLPYGETFYRIGPFFHTCKFAGLLIYDQVRKECFHEELVEIKACCDNCSFGDVFVEVDCDGEMLSKIKVKAFPAGNVFTDYFVKIGDKQYGPFSYTEFHLIELNLANGVYEIIFLEREFNDCATVTSFEVSCSMNPECAIDELIVETVNCTEESFQFLIDFSHGQMLNDLFELYINDKFIGTSSYSLLPLTTVKLNRKDGGPWKILVKDREIPDCAEDINIAEESCESSTIDYLDHTRLVNNGQKIGLYFNSELSEQVEISLYSYVGASIYHQVWNTQQDWTYDVNHLQSGLYLVRLKSSGKIKTYKVMVP